MVHVRSPLPEFVEINANLTAWLQYHDSANNSCQKKYGGPKKSVSLYHVIAAKYWFPVIKIVERDEEEEDEEKVLFENVVAPEELTTESLLKKSQFTPPTASTIEGLIKVVRSPIFSIRGRGYLWREGKNTLLLYREIPNLGRLGVPSLIPAEQMWQDLSSVLTNVLRNDPDKIRMPVIPDEDKIESHGFNKLSFRNPIK